MVEFVTLEETKNQLSQKPIQTRIVSFVMPLVLVNAFIYLMQFMFPIINQYLVLNPNTVLSQPWTILTAFFAHANPTHLFFNMFALYVFGSALETKIGAKRFLWFYLISGLIINTLAVFFYEGNLLGASGAIMAVIGMMIILVPNLKIYLYFVIPMRLWQLGILYFILDFFGLFVESGTANLAHLFGLFIGLGYGYYLLQKRKKFFKKFSENIHLSKKEVKGYKKL